MQFDCLSLNVFGFRITLTTTLLIKAQLTLALQTSNPWYIPLIFHSNPISQGMAVIIDLHSSDKGDLSAQCGGQLMADSNSVTFWHQVATKYKNDPLVLFELYNEPHDIPWNIWVNGGNTGAGFTTPGMQTLYNTVRATGANNTVIIGGLGYAYDLSNVTANAIIGFNIMYASHPYEYNGKPVRFSNFQDVDVF